MDSGMLATRIAIVTLALAATRPLLAQQYGTPSAYLDNGPDVLQRAPDFSLPWADSSGVGQGDSFSLSILRGKVVVLAFYPRDFTSGCTAEMQTFTAQYQDLFGPDVVVVGINNDSLETHARFAASLNLPFRLLTDKDQAVSKKYGSAGDENTNRRTVYVIGKNGDVAWRDTQFRALDAKSYQNLRKAIAAAVKAK
jgi:peroxiredoxin Q/BCP